MNEPYPRSSTVSPTEWATVWLRHVREHRKEDFWAWDELSEAVQHDPERAWPVVLALVQHAAPDELEYVGAGPIEHLIEHHDAAFIDRIETAAAADPRFRAALSTIWLNSLYHPAEIVARVVTASGGVIEPFELDYEKAEREEREATDGA